MPVRGLQVSDYNIKQPLSMTSASACLRGYLPAPKAPAQQDGLFTASSGIVLCHGAVHANTMVIYAARVACGYHS